MNRFFAVLFATMLISTTASPATAEVACGFRMENFAFIKLWFDEDVSGVPVSTKDGVLEFLKSGNSWSVFLTQGQISCLVASSNVWEEKISSEGKDRPREFIGGNIVGVPVPTKDGVLQVSLSECGWAVFMSTKDGKAYVVSSSEDWERDRLEELLSRPGGSEI